MKELAVAFRRCNAGAGIAGTLCPGSSEEMRHVNSSSIGKALPYRTSPALVKPAFVYQIRYDASVEVDRDFLALDNTANARPDWFEYWAIRNFLRTQSLDENAFYGFLSPRFESKTNLSGREVHEFIRRHGETADVILFSPSLHLTAYHLNVFKYGDAATQDSWASPRDSSDASGSPRTS